MSRTRLISALAAGLAILVAACWFVTGAFPLAAAPQAANDAPGVTVDLGGAGVMHRTGVAYPAAALKQGVQGTVVVEVKLDANGNVSDAHVVSGPDELRKAALQSVLQWHLMKNLAGSSRQVSITFSLPDSAPAQPSTAAAGVGGGVYRVGGGVTAPAAGQLSAVMMATAAAEGHLPPQSIWVGRTVKGINVYGLPDQARADLLAQLPVHEGDTLSADSLQNVARVANGIDEHLAIRVASAGGGGVTLEIMVVPGGAMTATAAGTMTATLPAASAGDNTTPPARIRVGANVQQSKLVSQPPPVYPPLARLSHFEAHCSLFSSLTPPRSALQGHRDRLL
jgi:TonB family protein